MTESHIEISALEERVGRARLKEHRGCLQRPLETVRSAGSGAELSVPSMVNGFSSRWISARVVTRFGAHSISVF